MINWIAVADQLPPKVEGEDRRILTICKKEHHPESNYPGHGIMKVRQDWVVRRWPDHFVWWAEINLPEQEDSK